MAVTDMELRLIYKAFAAVRMRSRFDEHMINDVASEMYTIALWREKAKGISRFYMTMRWLYADAIKLILGREILAKSWDEYYALCEGIDQMSLADLMSMYQSDTTRGVGSNSKNMKSLLVRELKKYPLKVNGRLSVSMNCEEIAELLGKQAIGLTPSQVVSNFRKRGKRFWLIEGRLWLAVTDFARSIGVSTKTAKKRYSILPMKIELMPEAKAS